MSLNNFGDLDYNSKGADEETVNKYNYYSIFDSRKKRAKDFEDRRQSVIRQQFNNKPPVSRISLFVFKFELLF